MILITHESWWRLGPLLTMLMRLDLLDKEEFMSDMLIGSNELDQVYVDSRHSNSYYSEFSQVKNEST
jgi:hypothetical protein